MSSPWASPAAFAALEAIESGEWDRYLLRLRGAIEMRRKTPEYEAHIVAARLFPGNDRQPPPPLTPGMEANQQVWVWLNDQWEIRGTGLLVDTDE